MPKKIEKRGGFPTRKEQFRGKALALDFSPKNLKNLDLSPSSSHTLFGMRQLPVSLCVLNESLSFARAVDVAEAALAQGFWAASVVASESAIQIAPPFPLPVTAISWSPHFSPYSSFIEAKRAGIGGRPKREGICLARLLLAAALLALNRSSQKAIMEIELCWRCGASEKGRKGEERERGTGRCFGPWIIPTFYIHRRSL